MTAMFGIVGTISYNTGNILLFLGQLAEVSYHAGVFALWMLPGLPFLYGYELLRKPSQAKNETVPMVLAAVVGLLVTIIGVLHGPLHFTGMAWCRIGKDIGLHVNVTHNVRCISQLWSGFKVKEAITREKIFKCLSLGIPGMLQLVIEVLANEMIALLCGYLPESEARIAIGASAISLQVALFVYMFLWAHLWLHPFAVSHQYQIAF